MISLSAAFTIMLLSLITGGCISAAYRNLRGRTVYSIKAGVRKPYVRHTDKLPFRGAIYGTVALFSGILDLVAIYLAVR